MKKRGVTKMAFNRIGTPVNIDNVDLKKFEAFKCSECGVVLGEKSGNMIKVAGKNAFVVAHKTYVCPKCGKEHHV